jgi:hypothetical protein
MKKQTLAIMEQSRKTSEREQLALQQAEEAMAAKDAAVLEAKEATTRENSMLELMLEASTDMLGTFLRSHDACSLLCCAFLQIFCLCAE